mmetsp:Transcript_21587/g.57057  ORF Transcript_21587/g.57057 Transcript_21587/m.57057 type:complete len:318 (-) Transcript_21587:34-987(-)
MGHAMTRPPGCASVNGTRSVCVLAGCSSSFMHTSMVLVVLRGPPPRAVHLHRLGIHPRLIRPRLAEHPPRPLLDLQLQLRRGGLALERSQLGLGGLELSLALADRRAREQGVAKVGRRLRRRGAKGGRQLRQLDQLPVLEEVIHWHHHGKQQRELGEPAAAAAPSGAPPALGRRAGGEPDAAGRADVRLVLGAVPALPFVQPAAARVAGVLVVLADRELHRVVSRVAAGRRTAGGGAVGRAGGPLEGLRGDALHAAGRADVQAVLGAVPARPLAHDAAALVAGVLRVRADHELRRVLPYVAVGRLMLAAQANHGGFR